MTATTQHPLYRRSVFLIILGGCCLSLLGIGMRIMDNADVLQIAFYRSLSQGLFLSFVLFYLNGSNSLNDVASMGARGVIISCLIAAAGLFMILSIKHTSVANAVFIVSLAPLTSAILGRVFLQEAVSLRTWLAIFIAIVGVALIFGDGLSGGGLLGMFFALLMMLFYSSSIVTTRSQNQANMIAVCALSGFILAASVYPFIDTLQLSVKDLVICVGLGAIQIGLGLVLVMTGAQYVPAAQVSLLALMEVVLSPIWVWVGVGETPSLLSLVGGTVVIVGVVIQTLDTAKNNLAST